MNNFLRYRLPLVIYMAAVFIASMDPAKDVLPDVWQIDKLAHAVVYFFMGIISLRAFRAASSRQRHMASAFMLSFSFGVFIEIAQGFTPERTPSVTDIIANSTGIILGIWTYGRLKRPQP